MSKQITISDDAFKILRQHMRDSGGSSSEEDEMDELFSVADQVWSEFDPEMTRRIKMLKLKAIQE